MSDGRGLFERILLPLDFTDANRRAVEIAARLAVLGGAAIELVHVIETVEGISFEELKAFYERLEAQARTKLEEVAADLERQGTTASWRITYGRRAEEILLHAGRNENDLIILSSHSLESSGRRSPGSISYKVGMLAQCPVLLVR